MSCTQNLPYKDTKIQCQPKACILFKVDGRKCDLIRNSRTCSCGPSRINKAHQLVLKSLLCSSDSTIECSTRHDMFSLLHILVARSLRGTETPTMWC